MSSAKRSWFDRFVAGWSVPAASEGLPLNIALITGCPRSGTTSVLNWLGAQPGVSSTDESRVLVAAHQFLDAVDRFTSLDNDRAHVMASLRGMIRNHLAEHASAKTRWLVEKEPLERIAFPDGRYGEFLRHVQELLPNARILFMLREPVATVASMCARRWGYTLTSGETREISLDDAIDTWLAGANLAQRMVGNSNIYLCRYDRLVNDSVGVSSEIARFLGLATHAPFVPRDSRPIHLTDAEQGRVRERTGEAWARHTG